MVRFDSHAIGDLENRHVGVTGQQCGQCTFMLRCQVLDEGNGETGVRRERAEHARERFKPTSRCAHADNGDVIARARLRAKRRDDR
jgi:hypothetical protein